MLENNFSCLDDNELMEINGGVVDPVTVTELAITGIAATASLIHAIKEGK